jgi:hypothetical protein
LLQCALPSTSPSCTTLPTKALFLPRFKFLHSFFFFNGTGDWTQGLSSALPLELCPSSFASLVCFSSKILCYLPRLALKFFFNFVFDLLDINTNGISLW